MPSLPDLSQVHDRFLSLSCISRKQFGDSLGGKLLLLSRFDADGIATVAAASIAGAASLCVDGDGDRLRDGLRAGLIDFVVGNLDEALRILKNELRRARPVSAGLTTGPETSIEAMIERGLQPDILSEIASAHADIFLQRGAVVLQDEVSPQTPLLEWRVTENSAGSLARIAKIAAGTLDRERSDTAARRRWLEHSARWLGRSFGGRQCLRMTDGEVSSLLPLLRNEFPALAVKRDGREM